MAAVPFYKKTNFKCQGKFDILRLPRSSGLELMKGNGTAPVTINGTHMVRASLTPMEAWPPLSLHMLLFMVCDFSSNLRLFNFLPTSQRNVRLTDWSIDVERLSSHIVLVVKLILLSLVWPMKGKTQYSLLHILHLKIRNLNAKFSQMS